MLLCFPSRRRFIERNPRYLMIVQASYAKASIDHASCSSPAEEPNQHRSSDLSRKTTHPGSNVLTTSFVNLVTAHITRQWGNTHNIQGHHPWTKRRVP